MKRAYVIANGHIVGDFPIHGVRDTRGDERPVEEGDEIYIAISDDSRNGDRPIFSTRSKLARMGT